MAKKAVKPQAKMGRPAGRVLSQATIGVRVSQDVKDRIQAYIDAQPIPPRESDVIRVLIERGMRELGI